MATIRFANNASTKLAANINSSTHTLRVQTGTGNEFPTVTSGQYFMATIINPQTLDYEIVKCTARSGDTLTITRGQEGTAPRSWTTTALIENRLTAGSLNQVANVDAKVAQATAQANLAQTKANQASASASAAAASAASIHPRTDENIRDVAYAGMRAGNGIDVSHNDAANTLTVTAETASQSNPGVMSFENVQDVVGAMVSGNTETNIAVTYDDSKGKLNFAAEGGGTVKRLGVRNTAGLWSFPTVTVNKPIYIGLKGFSQSSSTNTAKMRLFVNQGSDIGYRAASQRRSFELSASTSSGPSATPWGTVIIPTSNPVSIYITSTTGDCALYAYQ